MYKPFRIKKELPTDEAVLGFRLVFAEIALQLVSEESRKKVESFRLLSDASLRTGDLRGHVRKLMASGGLWTVAGMST